jgi:hypothetical protein
MWLLNTTQLTLCYFSSQLPRYAILSHVWSNQEVTYQDIQAGRWDDSLGCWKVRNACKRAAADQYTWIWIDTCCINKLSSAQLSEAINSMYSYYQTASVCYAYLADVVGSNSPSLGLSAWFSRGWTIQELIAPQTVVFLDGDWQEINTKANLAEALAEITGIPLAVLCGDPPNTCNVAQRMSWAARRETTREEDMAYCLMGILEVHMSPMYGEGLRNAFLRLQDEVLKHTADHTLFLWVPAIEPYNQGLLATSPRSFSNDAVHFRWLSDLLEGPQTVTNFYSLFLPLHDGEPELSFDHRGQYNEQLVPWIINHCSFPSLGPHGLQISLLLENVPRISDLVKRGGRRMVALDVMVNVGLAKRRVGIYLESESKINMSRNLPRRAGNMRRIVSIDPRSEYVFPVRSSSFRRATFAVSQIEPPEEGTALCYFRFNHTAGMTPHHGTFLDLPEPHAAQSTPLNITEPFLCRGGAVIFEHCCKGWNYNLFFSTYGSQLTPWVTYSSCKYLQERNEGQLEQSYNKRRYICARFGSRLSRWMDCYTHRLLVEITPEGSIDGFPSFGIGIHAYKELKRHPLTKLMLLYGSLMLILPLLVTFYVTYPLM